MIGSIVKHVSLYTRSVFWVKKDYIGTLTHYCYSPLLSKSCESDHFETKGYFENDSYLRNTGENIWPLPHDILLYSLTIPVPIFIIFPKLKLGYHYTAFRQSVSTLSMLVLYKSSWRRFLFQNWPMSVTEVCELITKVVILLRKWWNKL